MSKLTIPSLNGETITEQELATYRVIRPYLARCLTLNHEINNPLAGIIGYSEFVLEECTELSADHRRYLEQIMASAERIQKIVEDLCVEKIALNEKVDLPALIKELGLLKPDPDSD